MGPGKAASVCAQEYVYPYSHLAKKFVWISTDRRRREWACAHFRIPEVRMEPVRNAKAIAAPFSNKAALVFYAPIL